jgi:hypothetical protein
MHKDIHILQYKIFMGLTLMIYILYAVIAIGISKEAPVYLENIQFYMKIYICLFLIWRFNPFHKKVTCNDLDREIAFSSGLFLLSTMLINSVLITYIHEIHNAISSLF